MIGRRYDAKKTTTFLGTMSESYPLNGQIEMLCFNYSYNTINTLNELVSNFNSINHITSYDELQRTTKNIVLDGTKEVLSNTYSYGNKSLSLIEYENIKPLNISNIKRSYTYDSNGRITSIRDSIFGNHSYEYDYRGYLVKDENMSYTYDDNGNILSAGNNTYEYDSQVKDRVIKYNGSSILYSSNNPLNITKFNNMEFTYEGRRLKEVEIPYNNDYYYINKYEYNEQGMRIKKIKEKWYYSAGDDMTQDVTNYFYEGNNLVTEINSDCRLDFIYDENNRLYGLVYNKTNKYFYVRDILNNILGLIDYKTYIKIIKNKNGR